MMDKIKCFLGLYNWIYLGFKNDTRICLNCLRTQKSYICGASDIKQWKDDK